MIYYTIFDIVLKKGDNMRAVKQRPFAFSCCLFILALFLGITIGNAFGFITLISAFSLLAASLLLRSFGKRIRFLPLYVIPALLLASALSLTFNLNYNNIQTFDNKECYVEFVPERENYVSDTHSIYNVRIKSVNKKKADFKANLYFDGTIDSPLYSSYSATVIFGKYKNADSSSYNYSNLSDGTFINAIVVGEIKDNKRTDKSSLSYYFHKTNSILSSVLQDHLTVEEYALVSALILGNKSELSSQTKDNFQKLGLSHMLAVSGLHLSILIASFDMLIGRLKINKKKKYFLMIGIVFLYAGITGFSSSVKRAAFMLIVFYITFLVSKSSDSITSLCFSTAFICVLSPGAVFDIGLWLSALSTYGILEVALPITQKINKQPTDNIFKKALKNLYSSLIVGIVPIMFSLPIIWLSYSKLAFLSPLSNIIFTPFLLAIMYSCPLLLLLSFIPVISELISLFTFYSANIMLNLSNILSEYSPSVFLNYDFTVYLIIFLVVSYFIISLMGTKKKSVYFVPFLITALIFSHLVFADHINTLNDKKAVLSASYAGESFLIISENKAVLCDASGGNPYNARNALSQLKNNHIENLESYIITDYNISSIDSITMLSSSANLSNVYLPIPKTHDEEYIVKHIADHVKGLGVNVKYYNAAEDDNISFNGVDITIKHLSDSYINSQRALYMILSTEDNSYVYLSRGYDSTLLGKGETTKLFPVFENYIFGNYGRRSTPHVLALRFKDTVNAFFTSDALCAVYEHAIPEHSKNTVVSDDCEFALN